MENYRQNRISSLLQEEFAECLRRIVMESDSLRGTLISVTKVRLSADFSVARVYVSIFPSEHSTEIMDEIKEATPILKHQVSQIVKDQLRKMPEVEFFYDDSLDYIEDIDDSMRRKENPIENRELLYRRKKK